MSITRHWFVLLALLLVSGPLMGQFEDRKKHREAEEEEESKPRSYEEKWTLDPANEDPEWRLANKLYATGHYEETLRLFKKFLKESPNEVSVACSMAGIYWDLGKYDLAEQWYDNALEMVPKHVEAKKFRARMFYQMARWKESEELFKELIKVPNLRPDILGSAHLNLGKIALINRDLRAANRWFFEAAKSPRKGHRSQSEKGHMLVISFKKTRMWQSEETAGLRMYFSPEIYDAGDPAKRKAWADERQKAFDHICKTLGISFKEKLPVYVFKDEGESFEVTNQDVPTWKYSWWLVSTIWDRDPGYDLALQVVARVRGFRPGSKPLVTGLACYAAGMGDPHREARRLLKEGKLVSLPEAHRKQYYPLEEARLYGESIVAWLIDTYGMDKFLDCYVQYKLVLLDPKWESAATHAMDWDGVFSEIFRRGLGEDFPTIDRRWRDFLRKG